MKRNRVRIPLSVMLSSITALGLPLVAIVVIEPADYGAFSLIYLIGAAANILQLAVVSEAWARAADGNDSQNAWTPYINATIAVALLGAMAGLAVTLVVPEFRTLAIATAIAIFAQVYRNGSRFRAFRHFEWRYVLPGDAFGATATLGVSIFLILYADVTLDTVVICWAITRVAGLLGSRAPGRIDPRAALGWMRSHRRDIAVLASDAAMGDLASIAVPYALTPIMGLSNLGIYRGVSNVGGPVRTIVFPLRPILSRVSPRTLGSVAFLARVGAASAVLGASAYGALWGMSQTTLDLGTLNSLYPFAPVVGLYIFVMVGDTVYSMIARQVVQGRVIVTTRAMVAIVAVVAPITGAVFWGLSGAIWGYILHLLFSSVMWWSVVHRTTHLDAVEAAG